jgi:hypothetical protein
MSSETLQTLDMMSGQLPRAIALISDIIMRAASLCEDVLGEWGTGGVRSPRNKKEENIANGSDWLPMHFIAGIEATDIGNPLRPSRHGAESRPYLAMLRPRASSVSDASERLRFHSRHCRYTQR